MISKKAIIIFGALLIIVIVLITLNKTIIYSNKTEVNHDPLRNMKLKTIITDVAIGRQLDVKIKGMIEWVRVGGCKLILEKNQKVPTDYFQRGDSIIKDANSNYFIVKRGDEKFNWVIE